MVSPPDKNGYDIDFGNQAVATSANSVTYQSLGAFAGSPSGSLFDQYLSSRGASGWTTAGISPAQYPGFTPPESSQYEGFSADLSQMVVQSSFATTDGTFDLFARDPSGSFHLLDPGEPTVLTQGQEPAFRGASSDYSHIVFNSYGALTPSAPPYDGTLRAYEWVNGQLSLVSVNPDGTALGWIGDLNQNPVSNAISADGTQIYWTNGTQIYLRQNGASSSTEVTLPECTTNPNCPSPSGSGSFWTASTDGSKAFFTSTDQLTNNSTASSNGFSQFGDLYQYDANALTGHHLTDLTPDSTDPTGADVQGVIGASDDGSYVYFVANGVLAPGATPGSCSSGNTPATCNLYLWHNGATTFIATLDDSSPDNNIWLSTGAFTRSEFAQLSSDGLHLLFTSIAPPASGYNNAGHSEVYRYDVAGSGAPVCVSCDPSGASATGDAVLSAPADVGFSPVSANLTTINNMSSDATRVFFETNQALVPQDTNGTDDVYEWEAAGTGSCQTAGGCVYLVSSGRSGSPSHFLDASATGTDLFLLTREQLLAQDTDGNLDVYDARVGGGFPQPQPAPPPCSGEDCHGQPAGAPGVPVAASVTFVGPGNATPGSPPATVRVLTRAVRGTTFFLRVNVPAAGNITITGGQIGTVHRFVARAGTYLLRVQLSRQAKSQLRRKHKLKPRVRISYAPTVGQGSTSVITLRVASRVKR